MARRLGGLDTTALIGLIGTVVAALLSAGFLGDILVNPAVYVQLIDIGTSKRYMLITNDGSEPAHDLSLFIQSSSDKIDSITNTFSTTRVALVEPVPMILERGRPVAINTNSLQIFIPVLSSGIGSEVNMEILLESQSGGVIVNAVYDEGSTVGTVAPSLVREMSIIFSNIGYPIVIGFSIYAIGYVILLLWGRRYRKRTHIKRLVTTLENWRRKLEDDPYTPEGLYPYKRWYEEDADPIKWWKKLHSRVQDIMKNPKDYIIIDDLISKIENRNKKVEKIENELEAIQNTPGEEYLHEVKKHEVKKLNTECLDQINKGLNIEWDNYY